MSHSHQAPQPLEMPEGVFGPRGYWGFLPKQLPDELPDEPAVFGKQVADELADFEKQVIDELAVLAKQVADELAVLAKQMWLMSYLMS